MSCRESSKNWFAQICYLHYLYVIFILLVALIGVISYYHCSEKDKSLHEFISFAATLSSIILSVLAIFITVMSGESTNKLRDGIMGLLKIPEDLSNKVDQSVCNLNNATKNLNDAAKANEQIFLNNSKELKNAVENINLQIGKNFSDFGQKLDYIADNNLTGKTMSLKDAVDEPKDNKEEISDAQIEQFLSKTSSLSIAFIYLIDQYLQKNIEQPISLTEVASKYGYEKDQGINTYLIACIVFLNSFDLIQYKQYKKDDLNLIVFYSMSESLRSRYGAYYEKYKNDSCQEEIDNYLGSLMKVHSEKDSDSEQM